MMNGGNPSMEPDIKFFISPITSNMETPETDPQREYFPFLYSFKDAISEIPQKYRLEIYEAITDYAFFKKEPDLKTTFARFAWKVIFPILKKSWQKVENGRKGGGQLNNNNASKRVKNEQKTSKDTSEIEYGSSNIQANADIERDNENKIINNDNNNENEVNRIGGQKPSRKRETKSFTKPSLQEVKDYISENSFLVDPEAFYDYYESNGWMINKNRMKDWQATIRRWNRTENPKKRNGANPTPELDGFEVETKTETKKDYSERF